MRIGKSHCFISYKRLEPFTKLASTYAITVRLFNRVLGADDAPFGPVMGKRGDTDVVAGPAPTGADASSSGVIIAAASASETPSRCARAVRERAGASPRVRSAVSSTGKRR